MFIDTHLHIKKDNIEKIIKGAKENNVGMLIASGCDREEIIELLDVLNNYDELYATIGFHPSEADKVSDLDILWLEQQIGINKKILGVGEIGLDFYYGKDNKEEQIALFKKQLDLAQKLCMPVVIHTRDAFKDTYDILKNYNLRGIIHCFSGSLEVANLYINLGYALGIGGVITFRNSNLGAVVEKISLENIVLETDSPYLSPEPYRGSENSSKNIPIIADKISKVKKISTKDVEMITCANVSRIFDLKK